MALMYNFCFYLSVRLGTIIVGGFTLLQAAVGLIIGILWVQAPFERTRKVLKPFIDDSNLLFLSETAKNISQDPSLHSGISLGFSCFLLFSCCTAIYGAYYCQKVWLLPFIFLEGIFLIFLLFLHVIGMMLIKENAQDLGLLIGATLAGSFLLLFLVYCWACVVSLWQILNYLRLDTPPEERDEPDTTLPKIKRNRIENPSVITLPRANLIDELGMYPRYPRYPAFRPPLIARPSDYGNLIAPVY